MSRILQTILLTFFIIGYLLQVITTAAIENATAKCYERAQDYYPYFATRTAYENIHGHVKRLDNSCMPVQVWMLSRHGTRYPSKNAVPSMVKMTELRDQILKNHERAAGSLCSNDLNKLRNWQLDPNVNINNDKVLTKLGETQMAELAERLKQVFPDLFNMDNIKQEDYIFRATDTQRTQASMTAFLHGFFESEESIVKPEKTPVNDTLLLAHHFCPAWKSSYVTDHVSAERDKFADGPEVRAVIQNVGQRLGFSQDLDFRTIKTMYDLCRFETAWNPNITSTWCMIFRGDELKVLEYREDLDYYYFSGPGRSMTSKIGCHPLSDMYNHFKTLASGNFTNQPKGIFYFAHSVTLQTFMTALGINEESKTLLANNYTDVQDRHFRTSFFAPFATNVVATFYRCSKSEKPYKVTFYTAEKLTKLPGCQDGLCDWDFLEKKYAADVEKCSMDFCFEKVDNSTSAAVSIHSK